MKFSQILAFGVAAASSAFAQAYEYERLDKDNALVLVVDHQVGLYSIVRDMTPVEFHHSILAHASLADLFDLPIILTTSSEAGPNGPLPQEILDMHPNAPLVQRMGEVNAWDDPNFRDAVEATGKTQIIIAGIVTDVCTAFLAMSLRDAGYSVWANVEASGTTSELAREAANDQMRQAGIHVVTMFAIVCELMRDWRNTPGAPEVMPFLDQYFPAYGYIARGHAAAIAGSS